jgi:hypothetical protein
LTISQFDNFTCTEADAVYDLNGRLVTGTPTKGVYIIRKGNTTRKVVVR